MPLHFEFCTTYIYIYKSIDIVSRKSLLYTQRHWNLLSHPKIMKILCLVFRFVAFLLLSPQLEANLHPVETLRTIHIAQTAADIIIKYFEFHSNTIIFYRAAENDAAFHKQSDIVSEVLWRIGKRQKVLIESPGYSRSHVNHDRRRLNVFILDTYMSYKLIVISNSQ